MTDIDLTDEQIRTMERKLLAGSRVKSVIVKKQRLRTNEKKPDYRFVKHIDCETGEWLSTIVQMKAFDNWIRCDTFYKSYEAERKFQKLQRMGHNVTWARRK